MRIISNSEVTAYNECARRHYYQYQQGLQPRSFGIALTRGIVGHTILECYYTNIMVGCSVDVAKRFALDLLQEIIAKRLQSHPSELDHIAELSKLYPLLEKYIEYYKDDDFQILAVEKTYIAPINGEVGYGMKLDLLVKWGSGPYKGENILIDHKFIYNFKSDEELSIDGQLPKYIRTVAGSGEGVFVTRGIFNQLRYRELKNPDPNAIFRRSWIKPTKAAKEQIWSEQVDASLEIVDAPRKPRRTLSPLICKNCYFLTLCRTELNGGSTDLMRKVDYEPLIDRYRDWTGD